MQSQLPRRLVQQKQLFHAASKRGLSSASTSHSKPPKANLFRMIKFGAILLMATLPGPSFCVEGRPNNVPSNNKGDDNKPSFPEWVSNLSNQNGEEFFKKLQGLMANNPNIEAPVDAVKRFFESGMPGQVTRSTI